jgi:CheY-like chemotaxis protein
MTAQILVVDDEPDMKALVLQKFRHQIGDGAINFLFASDGIEALAMLEANSDIDMVVADIIENAVQVELVGEFELKGIRRPLAAYNVLAAAS